MPFSKREKEYLIELDKHPSSDFKKIMSEQTLKYILKPSSIKKRIFKNISYRRKLKYHINHKAKQMKEDLELYEKVKRKGYLE